MPRIFLDCWCCRSNSSCSRSESKGTLAPEASSPSSPSKEGHLCRFKNTADSAQVGYHLIVPGSNPSNIGAGSQQHAENDGDVFVADLFKVGEAETFGHRLTACSEGLSLSD